MKQTRRLIRLFALALSFMTVFTVITYITMVKTNASRWLNNAQNTRLREARKTTRQGTVYDCEMIALSLSEKPGERSYIANDSIRLAMSHTIGDQYGMSETGVENRHATALLGLSDITGADKTLQRLMGSEPAGYDVVLTVSAQLSAYVSSLFPQGSRGACVIVNYKTGAILGKVSLPAYDPADIGAAVQDTAYYDRVLQYRYAPGSTFKIVTLSSALENLGGIAEKQFDCESLWSFAGSTIRCAGGKAHGRISLKEAFSESCNITFAKLAYETGASNLRRTAENYAFNDNFLFEDVVLYSSHCLNSAASVSEVIQTGFGQGTCEATPLHMAMIAGAVANDGVMMEPKLIKEIRRPGGGATQTMKSAQYKRVTDSENAKTIAQYMYLAVRNGTGKSAQITGYTAGKVCGKTGSAEFSNDKEAGTHAWYVGFLYGDEQHPYAIAVIVEKGGSGGAVAAPIASKALKKAVEMNLY
ncbi:MAG: hypothetical protein II875_14195 [Clostridia bacterium]|nr:hypothetical protein [Clostridia bacterium]